MLPNTAPPQPPQTGLPPAETLPASLVFGTCELHPARRELRCGGELRELTPKVFDFLMLLLQRHDQALSKAEIFDTLWPGKRRTVGLLARYAFVVRQAIGDEAGRRLRSVRGYGYRYVGDVQAGEGWRSALTLPAPGLEWGALAVLSDDAFVNEAYARALGYLARGNRVCALALLDVVCAMEPAHAQAEALRQRCCAGRAAGRASAVPGVPVRELLDL